MIFNFEAKNNHIIITDKINNNIFMCLIEDFRVSKEITDTGIIFKLYDIFENNKPFYFRRNDLLFSKNIFESDILLSDYLLLLINNTSDTIIYTDISIQNINLYSFQLINNTINIIDKKNNDNIIFSCLLENTVIIKTENNFKLYDKITPSIFLFFKRTELLFENKIIETNDLLYLLLNKIINPINIENNQIINEIIFNFQFENNHVIITNNKNIQLFMCFIDNLRFSTETINSIQIFKLYDIFNNLNYLIFKRTELFIDDTIFETDILLSDFLFSIINNIIIENPIILPTDGIDFLAYYILAKNN